MKILPNLINKKMLAICFSILLVAGCTDGPIDTSSTELQQPDHYYEIDGWGSNPDIYEFTPRSNPNYTCIMMVESVNGVFCIPKPKGAAIVSTASNNKESVRKKSKRRGQGSRK